MQIEESRLFQSTFKIGVYYFNEKKIPRGLIHILGTSGVFSTKLNKSALLSCDLILVEKKLLNDFNGLNLNTLGMDELDDEAVNNPVDLIKRKVNQVKKN